MPTTEICPHCNADLRGEPIPDKYLKHLYESDPDWDRGTNTSHEQQEKKYGEGRCLCLPYGEGKTHFSRIIGVEIRGVYDGVLFWACPECGGTWHRWDLPDMRQRAAPYMEEWQGRE